MSTLLNLNKTDVCNFVFQFTYNLKKIRETYALILYDYVGNIFNLLNIVLLGFILINLNPQICICQGYTHWTKSQVSQKCKRPENQWGS